VRAERRRFPRQRRFRLSPLPLAQPQAAGVVATVRTDLYVAEISSRGGDIVRLELVRHGDTEDKGRNFVLFDNGVKHVYQAQSGVIGEGLPNHKTEWTLAGGERVLKDGDNSLEVRLEASAADGSKISKTYVFQRGSYQIELRTKAQRRGATPTIRLRVTANRPTGRAIR
jgi:YidC/Oxa1 family membrane protein insertase